jgi:hypothetical protein
MGIEPELMLSETHPALNWIILGAVRNPRERSGVDYL